jgi:cytochrome c553
MIETIASKLTRPLPAANPTFLTFADGNFGRTDSASLRESVQSILIGLQFLILALGTIGFLFATKRQQKRLPPGRTLLFVIFFILIGIAARVLYSIPTLSFIPPEEIVKGATSGIPVPDPKMIKSPEQKAMLERGRYLFSVASCAFCHNPKGDGGSKISWRPFGTLWTRNITSDPKAGIGAWKDEQIARAIRSGITPHGRVLHWQGMIWDHASNWDEEDVRSIIAYLRLLPPVSKEIPPTRPPAADDCEVYTFWTSESSVPGCR